MKFNVIATPRSGHSAISFWLAMQSLEDKEYLGDPCAKSINSNNWYSLTYTKESLFIGPHNEQFVIDAQLRKFLNEYSFKTILIDNQATDFCTLHSNKLPLYADHNIIVLRDFYNTFASLIKHQERNKNRWNNLLETRAAWITQASEVLNPNIVKDRIVILYNKWASSSKYRQKICKQLGLHFTDEGFNRVPHCGSGSSFDRTELDGEAEKMKVYNRFEQLKRNEEELHKLITPTIVNLNRKIFGGPHLEQYIKWYPWWYRTWLKIKEKYGRLHRKIRYRSL